jgi:hypothetical protein
MMQDVSRLVLSFYFLHSWLLPPDDFCFNAFFPFENGPRGPQLYYFCTLFYWFHYSHDTFSLALEKCVLLSNV